MLLLFLVLYWSVGFYPFAITSPIFFYKNNVQQTDRGGLSFLRSGIAYTDDPPVWVSNVIEDSAFELKLKVVSYNSHQEGPARIFTVSRDHYHRNLTVGQAQEDLIVRLRTPETGNNGTPDYVVQQVFSQTSSNPDTQRIIIRVRSGRLEVEVNGQEALSAPVPPNALSNWDPMYRLALGNEFTFYRPWQGEILEAVVHVRNQEISYLAERLQTPTMYIAVRENLSVEIVPCPLTRTCAVDPIDWATNLLGFLPFGFLLVIFRSKPLHLLVAFSWSAALSLSIEIGQLFFMDRIPSFTDLLLNSIGGAIGAWVANSTALYNPLFSCTKQISKSESNVKIKNLQN